MKWDLDLWYELWDRAGSQGLDTWYELRDEACDRPDTRRMPALTSPKTGERGLDRSSSREGPGTH